MTITRGIAYIRELIKWYGENAKVVDVIKEEKYLDTFCLPREF